MRRHRKQADSGNWQARAREFRVGQSVRLMYGGSNDEGRVLAVWPSIGMVDVQFPNTNYRFPVEDLQIINPEFNRFISPVTEEVPGGVGTDALVPDGATGKAVRKTTRLASAAKVKGAYFFKQALYWAEVGRKYRCTKSEHNNGSYGCPKCGDMLRKTIYKREDGRSVRLLGCPTCLFLIRESDILQDHCMPPCEDDGIDVI